MALHLTYRPNDFAHMFGNSETLESLENMLMKKNHPHVYLLSGPSGCGKTTVARIIASRLNCVGADYREINTADMRGIDTVREIIKQAQYKPLESNCRIWVIDECHKLTNDAQNALLKILEDTPSHVYFILATTDPDKLIAAIRSRCSVFSMNTLTDDEMLRLLKKIVKKEKDTLEQEVYDRIIQDSMGHPRAALTVLEQVLNAAPENRMEIAKRKAEEYNETIKLCRALVNNKSWKEIAEILRGLSKQEPELIRRAVMGYASAVLMKGSSNDTAGTMLEAFKETTYNSGFPGIVYAAYFVTRNH